MAYQPIENYGIIGNMQTAALIGLNGSIDWYCYPRFDSPSLFGAILDDQKGGQFSINVVGEDHISRKQLYWPDTNILITRFLTPNGIAEIEDFMPVGLGPVSVWKNSLFRRIRVVRGSVKLHLHCSPAFDYARQVHDCRLDENGALFITDRLTLALASSGLSLKVGEKGSILADFALNEGEKRTFIFYEPVSGQSSVLCPSPQEADSLFLKTVAYWRKWISSSNYHGRWREQVHRSALTLKLLSYEPTGALIAAPTCSLPEVIGGSRNWDYRYTWIRDSAFTVYGLLRIGLLQESAGFMTWLQGVISNQDPNRPMQIVYGIDGKLDLKEEILPHLDGYLGSRPVRIGNGAFEQYQLDVYGEAMDACYLSNKYVFPLSYDDWVLIRERLDWVCRHWKDPDRGIWESRAKDESFVYSRLMCWVALDRGIRLAEKRSFPADSASWLKVRNEIYEDIIRQGWNEKIGAYTQTYGGTTLDASNLIMPLVFFMSPSDPRMLKTIDAINRSPQKGGLVCDGLVYRYNPSQSSTLALALDGMNGYNEGTFNMCSFWLVEALTRAGRMDPSRLDEARLLFERMLGYANHLGLYGEETSAEGGALGNFPQAFTHMALISAAYNLDKALGERK